MITKEEYNGLNFNNIEKHVKEIEEFDGDIPFLLYNCISISNRLEYLERINQKYEREKLAEHRKNITFEREIEEVIEWVNNNPMFSDIIKIKK